MPFCALCFLRNRSVVLFAHFPSPQKNKNKQTKSKKTENKENAHAKILKTSWRESRANEGPQKNAQAIFNHNLLMLHIKVECQPA